MRVPLTLISANEELKVCYNGKFKNVKFPFAPFCLAEKSKFPNTSTNNVENWLKIPDQENTEYMRLNFETMDDQRSFLSRNIDKIDYIYKNSYSEQLYMTDPNFILEYGNTNDLVVMFWDIEVLTIGDGIFPTSDKRPIICIGYSIWNYKNDGSREKVCQKIVKGYDIETEDDTLILEDFCKAIVDHDPDILVGYNSEQFDFPYLYERCKINNINMRGVGREDKEPWISPDGRIHINGRIHYDMMKKVFKDQSLFGLKSKTLKEVARHYEVPLDNEHDIELRDAIFNTRKIITENPKLLYDYQDADVIRTEHTGQIYIRNDITLAEKLQVPLENTMNGYSSFIPKIVSGREMYQRGIISTSTNFSKYNSLTGKYHQFDRHNDKELRFQGALVGLYKHGHFPMTYKLDFSSMYPSAICTWNLGPDTTKLIEVRPYTGKYSFTQSGKYGWHVIPDKNFNVDLVVRVRNDKDGFLKQNIKSLWAERAAIKAEAKIAKAAGETEKLNALDSQQMAVKVILNSIYGLQGLKSSTYGDMISGVMVTAMCRWTTTKTIQRYEKCLVELDTDGLAIDKRVDEAECNSWLDGLVLEHYNITDNYMKMELDVVGQAYFIRMKNYVVEIEGHTHIHGSSLKSSRICGVVDRARDLAIEHWFHQKPIEEVIREAYDFSECSLNDFKFRVRLAKRVDDYDDRTGQVPFLAKQHEMVTGQIPNLGDQLHYVIANNQLDDNRLQEFYQRKSIGKNYRHIELIQSVKDIDPTYYNDQIDKMLDKFQINRVVQEDLFAGVDNMERTPSGVRLHTVPHDI